MDARPASREHRNGGSSSVSTELGLVLLVTLLWGPTALWLGYRAIRGHRGRLSGSSGVAFEPMRSSQPSLDEIEALVARDRFWVCWTCRSLNRREARVCYGCQAAMGSAGGQTPGELPVTPHGPGDGRRDRTILRRGCRGDRVPCRQPGTLSRLRMSSFAIQCPCSSRPHARHPGVSLPVRTWGSGMIPRPGATFRTRGTSATRPPNGARRRSRPPDGSSPARAAPRGRGRSTRSTRGPRACRRRTSSVPGTLPPRPVAAGR